MTASAPPDTLDALRRDARAIFSHALDACRIERAFAERIRLEGTTVVIEHSPALLGREVPPSRIDLRCYRDVLVIALGKAAVPMTTCLLDILPRRPRVRGICVAPQAPKQRDPRIRYYAGGHPVPNRDSFRAARAALRMLRRAGEKTLVLYLISGGGSTLFELPLDPAISLEDTIGFHRALLASGAPIAEMNTLRKHFSAVKGGRLAPAAQSAHRVTLLVVDVPAPHWSAVASGPTLADPSTVDDCRNLLERYRLAERFPTAVRSFFERADLPETPGNKLMLLQSSRRVSPGQSVAFATVTPWEDGVERWLFPLLSERDLLAAARAKAADLDYELFLDNGCDDWPYDRAAAYLVDRLIELRHRHPGRRLCLLSGGEVTVTLDRRPGSGGRNQQFALAVAGILAERLPGLPVVCLSAGSDGVDGNSPAAGALADPATLARAQALGFSAQAALAAFDAAPLFQALDDDIVTGPTGNNLRDLRLLLSA